jgi:hypothetical protein
MERCRPRGTVKSRTAVEGDQCGFAPRTRGHTIGRPCEIGVQVVFIPASSLVITTEDICRKGVHTGRLLKAADRDRVACGHLACICDDGTLDRDDSMTTVFPLPSPMLPDFTTLLLKGPYHASAPIHLCLTHLANRPGSRAVLLTPSRENFVAALRDFNDDWLNECGGYGAVSQVLSRVDVLFVSNVHTTKYRLTENT